MSVLRSCPAAVPTKTAAAPAIRTRCPRQVNRTKKRFPLLTGNVKRGTTSGRRRARVRAALASDCHGDRGEQRRGRNQTLIVITRLEPPLQHEPHGRQIVYTVNYWAMRRETHRPFGARAGTVDAAPAAVALAAAVTGRAEAPAVDPAGTRRRCSPTLLAGDPRSGPLAMPRRSERFAERAWCSHSCPSGYGSRS